MQRYKNPILVLLVLIIVIAGGTVWYTKFHNKPDTIEAVNITNTDLTTEGADKIPVNFPKDVPIQPVEITNAYEMEYPERGVVVSVVNLKTNRGAEEIFESYKNSLTNFGYLLDERSTSSEGKTLHFIKDNNSLTITIISVMGNDEELDSREISFVYTTNT